MLPLSIGDLSNLQGLCLQNNRIEHLAKSFDKLKNLERLDLAFNQLETLPDSFGKLKKLDELWLGYNPLITLPDTSGIRYPEVRGHLESIRKALAARKVSLEQGASPTALKKYFLPEEPFPFY